MKNIKVSELLSSKIYVKENSAVNFKSPEFYIRPFLDMMGEHAKNTTVQVYRAIINAEADGTKNIAYPRINIECRIGTEIIGFHSVIGLIYALDTQIPIAKVYTGQSVSTCLNLCIFGAEDIYETNMLNSIQEIYNRVEKFKSDKLEQVERYTKIYKDMTETHLTPAGMKEILGNLLIKGSQSKLGTSPVVAAAQSLIDPKSMYYVNEGADFKCNQWNIYNAVTQSLTDSTDPVYRPNKTLELTNIIRNIETAEVVE